MIYDKDRELYKVQLIKILISRPVLNSNDNNTVIIKVMLSIVGIIKEQKEKGINMKKMVNEENNDIRQQIYALK